MKKLLIFIVFLSQLVVAQSADSLFVKANKQYKDGQFENAIKTYQEIEALGVSSSELYFNLGNCYYKLNEVAPTIYNYEKALLLDPLNEDAKNNLLFASSLTIDTIEALPKSVFQKLDEAFIKKLTFNQWAYVAILCSFLGSILFLCFYYAYTSSRKRLYFITSMLSFFLLFLSVVFTFKEYRFTKNNKQAIIFAEKIDIKNAPTTNSEVVFTLHEGTKVKVLDLVDNWNKIKIADGQVGWISANNIKLLN